MRKQGFKYKKLYLFLSINVYLTWTLYRMTRNSFSQVMLILWVYTTIVTKFQQPVEAKANLLFVDDIRTLTSAHVGETMETK